jgi:AhpD family alkylhydroperoxidase
MDHMDEIREELRQPSLDLRALIPDVMKGYAALSSAAFAEGELAVGVKELLALVIAITRECDGCMVAHARGCVRAGVSRQQVAEAIGVAIAHERGTGHRLGTPGPARLTTRPWPRAALKAVGQVLDAVDEARRELVGRPVGWMFGARDQ